jgi:hypothetical protein
MRERVFGYQMVSGRQVEVADTPIPQQLEAYCDGVILENKIKDHFHHMHPLPVHYARVQARLDKYR